MTASERLRELADYAGLDMPGDYIDRLDVVADALPLIADVVEAAEGYIAERQADLIVGDEANMEVRGLIRLRSALTALQEHLEEQ